MTLNHYIVAKDGRILKFLKYRKSGNPYKDDSGRFTTKEVLEKAIKMYFIDQYTGTMMTKEEFDRKLANMFLDIKEVDE